MEVAAHMPCVHGRKRSKCEDCAKEKERWREARAAGIRASVARANELAPQASAIAAAQMAMARRCPWCSSACACKCKTRTPKRVSKRKLGPKRLQVGVYYIGGALLPVCAYF